MKKLESTIKKIQLITYITIVILLFVSCADIEAPHTTQDHYTRQPRIKMGTTEWNLSLIEKFNINTKRKQYETAIRTFDKSHNQSDKDPSPEVIEAAIRTIITLEQSISQFKNAGGDPYHVSVLESSLYKDKNYFLLIKFGVIKKTAQYFRSIDSFSLNHNQHTAWDALKINSALSHSITQFKRADGDPNLILKLEKKLAKTKSVLEGYIISI